MFSPVMSLSLINLNLALFGGKEGQVSFLGNALVETRLIQVLQGTHATNHLSCINLYTYGRKEDGWMVACRGHFTPNNLYRSCNVTICMWRVMYFRIILRFNMIHSCTDFKTNSDRK